LIKNSWSSNWGDHGFIKIRHGLCGVEKRPFVVLNKGRKTLPWQQELKEKRKQRELRRAKLPEQLKPESTKHQETYRSKIVRKDAIEDPADFSDIEDDFNEYLDDEDRW